MNFENFPFNLCKVQDEDNDEDGASRIEVNRFDVHCSIQIQLFVLMSKNFVLFIFLYMLVVSEY